MKLYDNLNLNFATNHFEVGGVVRPEMPEYDGKSAEEVADLLLLGLLKHEPIRNRMVALHNEGKPWQFEIHILPQPEASLS